MKNDVKMYLSKGNKPKKIFFVDILKATGEKSRIRIRIRIRMSVVRILGSGSVPKCYGSTTMVLVPGDTLL
jgi:hypothetical protein